MHPPDMADPDMADPDMAELILSKLHELPEDMQYEIFIRAASKHFRVTGSQVYIYDMNARRICISGYNIRLKCNDGNEEKRKEHLRNICALLAVTGVIKDVLFFEVDDGVYNYCRDHFYMYDGSPKDIEARDARESFEPEMLKSIRGPENLCVAEEIIHEFANEMLEMQPTKEERKRVSNMLKIVSDTMYNYDH